MLGRKAIGTKLTYTISEGDYEAFKAWCKERGIKVSAGIRVGICHLMVSGSLERLLKDRKLRREAIRLLKNKENKGVD